MIEKYKPHIYKSYGIWFCKDNGACFVGYGNTPKEAYTNYAKLNFV